MIFITRGFGLLLVSFALAGCTLRSSCGPAPYMEAQARAQLVIPDGMDVPDQRFALRVPAPDSVGGRLANDASDCIIEPPAFYADPGAESALPRGPGVAPAAAVPVTGSAGEIERFVLDWAARWNQRDADAWLPLYAPDFAPSGYAGPEAWQAEQRRRFELPAATRVDLDTLVVEPMSDGLARARFVQYFGQAPEERAVRKELVLLETRAGSWVIIDEQIIEVL